MAPALLLLVVLAACGTERNMDNPRPEGPGTLETTTTTSSTTTLPTITAFVPSTAPTTLAPPTAPPTAATYAPTVPPTTPTPTRPPVETIASRYTVVAGDSLSVIANKLGVKLDDLLAANGFNTSSLIVPGDQLAIPAGGTPVTNPVTAPATSAAPATNPPSTNPPATNPQATNPASTGAPTTAAATTTAAVAPTTTFAPPANALTPATPSASCQAPDSAEANGTPIVFAPANVLDHNPATAWRCQSGAAQTLTFTFPSAVHLDSVGLIGGYVKVDPLTGVDRFVQNERVRQVEWAFSDGTNSTSVTQDLADARSMQTVSVDAVATTVTMTVTATYPAGGPLPRDMVAVAEVQFTGTPQ
jgi:LysM repeat protein